VAERVLEDWAKAKGAGTIQQDFWKDFCAKYEGARKDDVEFVVWVIEDMITETTGSNGNKHPETKSWS